VDQSTLVENGHALINLLSEQNMKPRAALWVTSPETGIWRLWIVPNKAAKDKYEFYKQIAELISKNRANFSNLEISDIEYVPDTHPAIAALRRMMKVTGNSVMVMQSSSFNGVFLPDSIILEMDFE